jgi:hypothetical protein
MKRAAIAGLIGLLTACGGGDSLPLAPSPSPPAVPPFPTGTYWLLLSGYDIPVAPVIPACDPAGAPPAGKHVAVELDVVRQGPEWVGRPARDTGDLELRFRDGGELAFGLRAFTGTLRGEAPDGGVPGGGPAIGVSIAIDGTGTIDGQTALPLSARVLSGKASGAIHFKDGTGQTGNCSAVALTIVTDRSVFAQGTVFMDHLPSR